MTKCKAITRKGNLCRVKPIFDDGFCHVHSPKGKYQQQIRSKRTLKKQISKGKKPNKAILKSYRRNPKDHCYFVLSTSGLTKIGTSINPEKRFSNLTTMSPEPIKMIFYIQYEKSICKLERTLHKLYRYHRTHGEWFTLQIEDFEKLADLMQTPQWLYSRLAKIKKSKILEKGKVNGEKIRGIRKLPKNPGAKWRTKHWKIVEAYLSILTPEKL